MQIRDSDEENEVSKKLSPVVINAHLCADAVVLMAVDANG